MRPLAVAFALGLAAAVGCGTLLDVGPVVGSDAGTATSEGGQQPAEAQADVSIRPDGTSEADASDASIPPDASYPDAALPDAAGCSVEGSVCDDFEAPGLPLAYTSDGTPPGFVDLPSIRAMGGRDASQALTVGTTGVDGGAESWARRSVRSLPTVGTFAVRAFVRYTTAPSNTMLFLTFSGEASSTTKAPPAFVVGAGIKGPTWVLGTTNATTDYLFTGSDAGANANEWACVEIVTTVQDPKVSARLFVDSKLVAEREVGSVAQAALGGLSLAVGFRQEAPPVDSQGVFFDDVASNIFPNDIEIRNTPRIGCD